MDKKLPEDGVFGWFELQTPDVAAAKKICKALCPRRTAPESGVSAFFDPQGATLPVITCGN